MRCHLTFSPGVCPEKGHKSDLRDGTPFLQGQAERAVAVQHGEEKVLGRPESSLSASRGGVKLEISFPDVL